MNAGEIAPVAGAWLVTMIAPGPDVVLVLRQTAREGRAAGMAAGIGVVGGILVWTVLAMAGAHVLVEADDHILGTLQLVGGLFLAWLGAGALRAARGARAAREAGAAQELGELATFGSGEAQAVMASAESGLEGTATGSAFPSPAGQHPVGSPGVRALQRSWGLGLLTNLSNPKALIFFGSVFTVLIPQSASLLARSVLAAVLLLATLAWFTGLAWLASRGRAGALLARHTAGLDTLAGLTFILLGVISIVTGGAALS